MYELLKALKEKFAIDATLSVAIPGGLHLGEAPPGTVMPYVLMIPVSGTPEFTTGKTYTQRTTLQFSLFTASAADAATIGRTLRNWITYRPLNLDVGKMLAASLTNEFGPTIDVEDEDSEPAYQYVLEFEFLQLQQHA